MVTSIWPRAAAAVATVVATLVAAVTLSIATASYAVGSGLHDEDDCSMSLAGHADPSARCTRG